MAIFTCTECGKSRLVKDELAWKKAKCPKCGCVGIIAPSPERASQSVKPPPRTAASSVHGSGISGNSQRNLLRKDAAKQPKLGNWRRWFLSDETFRWLRFVSLLLYCLPAGLLITLFFTQDLIGGGKLGIGVFVVALAQLFVGSFAFQGTVFSVGMCRGFSWIGLFLAISLLIVPQMLLPMPRGLPSSTTACAISLLVVNLLLLITLHHPLMQDLPGWTYSKGSLVRGLILGLLFAPLLSSVNLAFASGGILPYLTYSRELAHRSLCLSKMKSLSLGLFMYAADSNASTNTPSQAHVQAKASVGNENELVVDVYQNPNSSQADVNSGRTRLPACLGALYISGLANDGIWNCSNLEGQFEYLGPDLGLSAPKDLLLCYENPAWHGGEGGNVIFTDGSVKWLNTDEFSSRLDATKRWISDHPIPVDQNVETANAIVQLSNKTEWQGRLTIRKDLSFVFWDGNRRIAIPSSSISCLSCKIDNESFRDEGPKHEPRQFRIYKWTAYLQSGTTVEGGLKECVLPFKDTAGRPHDLILRSEQKAEVGEDIDDYVYMTRITISAK